MPKDGRKNITPISKKTTHPFKTLFFQCFFGKTETCATKKLDFDPGRQAALRQPGGDLVAWRSWIFFVASQRWKGPFFGRDELKGAKGGSYTYPGFDQHILVGVFFFEVLLFLVGTSEKKNILKLVKGPQKKTKQLFFCMLSFFGRFFREIFLFVMFVLCFCGGEKERAAVYQPDTTRKLLGFMGKSTFVCSLAIWKEKWWVPNDYFLEI